MMTQYGLACGYYGLGPDRGYYHKLRLINGAWYEDYYLEHGTGWQLSPASPCALQARDIAETLRPRLPAGNDYEVEIARDAIDAACAAAYSALRAELGDPEAADRAAAAAAQVLARWGRVLA